MKIHALALAMAGMSLGCIPASTDAQTKVASSPDDVADGAFVARSTFGEPTGEALFRRVCAACHMPDAKGAEGAGHYPALAANQKLKASTYPVYVILHGLNGMPAIGDMMTDKQVADVTNYLRTNFGNKYKDAVSEADVKGVR
ncbi:MAG: cytochrome c [Sphingobium sp.]|nr:cytochrome c [Sphingobium sp.]